MPTSATASCAQARTILLEIINAPNLFSTNFGFLPGSTIVICNEDITTVGWGQCATAGQRRHPVMLRIHWNFCMEVPCMEYLSLRASSKENYTMCGVIYLPCCLPAKTNIPCMELPRKSSNEYLWTWSTIMAKSINL